MHSKSQPKLAGIFCSIEVGCTSIDSSPNRFFPEGAPHLLLSQEAFNE
jgi:hypothetical protein